MLLRGYTFSSHIICILRNRLFHVGLPLKSSGIEYKVDKDKRHPNFRTKRRKKTMSISSSLVQQLARPVSAAVVDFVPLVQGGCCRSEHDEELLLKAQAAHPRGWVVAACPCQYLPGDGVRVALVFQLPHMGR